MGTESSDEHPKVSTEYTRTWIRRMEDKVLLILCAGMIGLVVFIWQAQASQIGKLEDSKNDHEKRISVTERDVSGIQKSMEKLINRIEKVLEEKH